jgi:DNA-binding LytR/AlgR family response regulator
VAGAAAAVATDAAGVVGRLVTRRRRNLRELVLAAARELREGLAPGGDQRLILKVGRCVTFVDPLEIEYVEGDRNYVVVCAGGSTFRARATLGDVEARLAMPRFVRIHRSVIVNTTMCASIEKWFHGEYIVTMRSGRTFNSGRIHRHRMHALMLSRLAQAD